MGYVLAFALLPFNLAAGEAPPTLPVLDLAAMDRRADPCEDFYQFACGGWHKKNPIPDDESFWSRPFSQFARQVDEYVSNLILETARSDSAPRSDQRMIGDYFSACMNLEAIEAAGIAPLREELAVIDSIGSYADLPAALGALHAQIPWFPQSGEAFFWFDVTRHDTGSGITMIPRIGTAGLGMFSPDYYLEVPDNPGLKDGYERHIAEVLEWVGMSPRDSWLGAQNIYELESRLAAAWLPKDVARNDPSSTHNPMTIQALQALTPGFNWQAYFQALGVPQTDMINPRDPDYFHQMDQLLADTPVETIKAYLRWQLVAERTEHLPERLRNSRFEFFGRRLSGTSEPIPRQQVCLEALETDMPGVLGRVFVEAAYDPQTRQMADRILVETKAVLKDRIRKSDWLAEETRAVALAKVDAATMSTGHPETWLDDRSLVVRSDDHYGNVRRSGEALRRVSYNRIGRAPDANWWVEPVTWMGGYYASNENRIIITAAMLLALSDTQGDPAQLYGGMGTFVAHELIHGFDPTGSQYDERGRRRDWWTEADRQRFGERTQCVADQFSTMEYAPGIPIDGDYVVSEQFTELFAISVAAEMMERAYPQALPVIEGLTGEQRLQVANAQVWCTDATEGGWKSLAAGAGGGSKAWARPMVNGTLINVPEFTKAFQCQAGQAMVKPADQTCATW